MSRSSFHEPGSTDRPDAPAALARSLADADLVDSLADAARDGHEDAVVEFSRELVQRLRRPADGSVGHDLHRLLVQSVTDHAIFALDPHGDVVSWNAGAERMKGYARDEILGRHFSTFYPPDARERRLPERLLGMARVDGSVHHEGWRVRKDGSRFWAAVTITAIRDEEDGTLRGFAKVTRDLTEKHYAQERLERRVADRTRELEHANRALRAANESLEAFSYLASHDLKEPVRALDALLGALREDHADALPPDARDLLDRAFAAEVRLQHLVTGLLDLSRASRMDGGDGGPVRVADAFHADATRTRIDHLVRERHVTLDVRLDPAHVVRGTSEALAQVLGNLVVNAIRHNPDPTPLVRVQSEEHEDEAHGRVVHVVVEDNGPGFPEAALRRFREGDLAGGSLHGSGFGLLIVRRTVERLGGSVGIGASPEGGASVRVTLPAART